MDSAFLERGMVLLPDTSSWYTECLCRIILKSCHENGLMHVNIKNDLDLWDMNAWHKHLSWKCSLDLWDQIGAFFWFWLIMPNPCAKLFLNPCIHKRTTAWTGMNACKHWNCTIDLDLWDKGVVLCVICLYIPKHLCQIISKSLTYSPDINGCILTFKLQVWQSSVVLSCDTTSWYAKHLCQVIWKSIHAVQSYGQDTKNLDTQTNGQT